MATGPHPLFSVICFCKNRASSIGRSVESVLNQSYPNLEFVVQDGASTDGTLALLQAFAERDSRVKIVSSPDTGAGEAHYKALRRCRGQYIATCLAGEELVSDALENAVGWFAQSPTTGAFTCDGHITDATGKSIDRFGGGEFDFVAYVLGIYLPFLSGSFFQRRALIDIGLERPGWDFDCFEFEVWCRLGCDHEVRYQPFPIAKYTPHPRQYEHFPVNYHETIDARLKLIGGLFSADGFFGAEKNRERQAKIDVRLDLYGEHWLQEIDTKLRQSDNFQYLRRGRSTGGKDAREYQRVQDAIKEELVSVLDQNIGILVARNADLPEQELRRMKLSMLWQAWERRCRIPQDAAPADRLLRWKLRLLRFAAEHVLVDRSHPLKSLTKLTDRLGLHEQSSPAFEEFANAQRHRQRALISARAALVYEARGQIRQALDMWRTAEALNDPHIDALACQQSLKNPEATYESIAALQQRWVDRHIRAAAGTPAYKFTPFDGTRRIRIGYHCSFMDSDTVRYIMRRVFMAHDRRRFDVLAYTYSDLPEDMRSAFDSVLNTASLSDEEFCAQVRRDRIDVFVELTGLSYGHRFGAMALRCAPVQISYLNHFATSRTPNVDYVLSDSICTPPGAEVGMHFTESIYRLPGCLLRYDYTDGNSPDVSAPPFLSNGYVTFGCFGSTNKINTRVVELWSRVLSDIPRSRILIQHTQLDPPDNRRYLADRFARGGISADRVLLRPGTNRMGILKAYDEIDISFDTWPYCGGNTVAESLWQGVPVISLKGQMFSGRYGASLLHAAHCQDLIAETFDEYVDIAVRLASDPERLQTVRRTLRSQYTRGGLNDSTGFARHLEDAYAEMLGRWARAPADLTGT